MCKLSVPKYDLRIASKQDIDWLVKLRKLTMRGYLEASGFTVSNDELKKRVLYKFQHTKIIRIKNQNAGMIKLSKNEPDWELIQIQVLPEYQGTGVGTALLKGIILEAKSLNANITLSVLKTNPAISLYKKLGFIVSNEDESSYKMRFSKNT